MYKIDAHKQKQSHRRINSVNKRPQFRNLYEEKTETEDDQIQIDSKIAPIESKLSNILLI